MVRGGTIAGVRVGLVDGAYVINPSYEQRKQSALDLVVAVSASGASPETLAAVGEAGRRGAHVVGIAGGGPLVAAVADARGVMLGVGGAGSEATAPARLLLWRLAAPLLLLSGQLGLVEVSRGALAAAADELDAVALACGPAAELGDNVAKDVGLLCAEGVPMIWGTPGIPAAAARRFARQLAENAAVPALHGALPEVARTHARILADHAANDGGAIFRDRVDEGSAARRPSLTLLREADGDALDLLDQLAGHGAILHRAAAPRMLSLGRSGESPARSGRNPPPRASPKPFALRRLPPVDALAGRSSRRAGPPMASPCFSRAPDRSPSVRSSSAACA